MAKIKQLNRKLPFNTELIANKVIETFKTDGPQAAFDLISQTMLIFSNAINMKFTHPHVKREFKKFQKLLKDSKTGISVNDNAFVEMLRQNHPRIFTQHYRKYVNK